MKLNNNNCTYSPHKCYFILNHQTVEQLFLLLSFLGFCLLSVAEMKTETAEQHNSDYHSKDLNKRLEEM